MGRCMHVRTAHILEQGVENINNRRHSGRSSSPVDEAETESEPYKGFISGLC